MKVEFVLDKGYPHGEIKEIFDFDEDTPQEELTDELYDWVLVQARCHYIILE